MKNAAPSTTEGAASVPRAARGVQLVDQSGVQAKLMASV
jgi:hypothetical protein